MYLIIDLRWNTVLYNRTWNKRGADYQQWTTDVRPRHRNIPKTKGSKRVENSGILSMYSIRRHK